MTNDAAVACEPVAWVERTEAGLTRMWSGDLSAWAHRPANPEPLYSATTVAELRDEILELKAQLAREEHDHGTTIDSRDRAEEALGDMFMAVTGREAEWSSAWGFADAIQEVEDHMLALTKESP